MNPIRPSKITDFCQQQVVLQISLSNSTFPSKGLREDMFFVLDIMQVTFVTKPIVNLQTVSLNSQGMGTQKQKRAMLQSTCLLVVLSSNCQEIQCRYLGSKWGGPLAVLGLRSKAIHE